jgi:hypothetical protein
MFQEFVVRVMFVKDIVSEEQFDKAWMKIGRSEPQYGVYVGVYTIDRGVPPPTMSDSMKTFRNDVIHKGKIPSEDEAVRYGEVVFNVIEPILSDLKTKERSCIGEVLQRHVLRLYEQARQHGAQIVTMAPTRVLSIITDVSCQETLRNGLARIRADRQRFGW